MKYKILKSSKGHPTTMLDLVGSTNFHLFHSRLFYLNDKLMHKLMHKCIVPVSIHIFKKSKKLYYKKRCYF